MAFAKLQSRILSAVAAVQAAKVPSVMGAGDLALAHAGRPCTNRPQNCHGMRNGEWLRRYGKAQRRMQAHVPRVLCGRAMMGTCASNLWLSPLSTRFAASAGGAMNSAPRTWGHADMERHVPEVYFTIRRETKTRQHL